MKSIEKLLADKPNDAPPVPLDILDKYSKNITDIWWYAKGRTKDPSIGIEINGLKKTYGGYTYDGWWYFMKLVHAGGDGKQPQCYWYRKKKVKDKNNSNRYKIIEEYVGVKLHNPDTGDEFLIPNEIKHNNHKLCIQHHKK